MRLVRQALILIILSSLISLVTDNKASAHPDLIDYSQLDQRIVLRSLRAGNHDQSGINSYYFTVTVHALLVTQEERRKSFDERQKLSRSLGRFAEVTVKSLDFWREEGSQTHQKMISGELIRNLVSDAMRKLESTETEIATLVQVRMYEANKRFIFFGEDTFVGEESYYIIPESLPHRPLIENKTMEISDELGTFVKLDIKYKLVEAPQALRSQP